MVSPLPRQVPRCVCSLTPSPHHHKGAPPPSGSGGQGPAGFPAINTSTAGQWGEGRGSGGRGVNLTQPPHSECSGHTRTPGEPCPVQPQAGAHAVHETTQGPAEKQVTGAPSDGFSVRPLRARPLCYLQRTGALIHCSLSKHSLGTHFQRPHLSPHPGAGATTVIQRRPPRHTQAQ